MDRITAELASYYDREAPTRAARAVDEQRAAWRRQFIDLLRAEHRTRLIEIGCGPGRDAVAFGREGLAVTGIELSVESSRLARSAGVAAVCGSLYELPIVRGHFPAAWSMSTLVHVPDSRFDEAMGEICATLAPGSPFALGLWGGVDHEGPSEFDTIQPPRFFSVRSHDRIQRMLAAHGSLQHFETKRYEVRSGWEYQFAILRVP